MNVVERIVEIINGLGSAKIVVKSNHDYSLNEVQLEARKELWNEMIEYQNKVKISKEGASANSSKEDSRICGGEVLIENSPVGSPRQTVWWKKAVQDVQGFIRAA